MKYYTFGEEALKTVDQLFHKFEFYTEQIRNLRKYDNIFHFNFEPIYKAFNLTIIDCNTQNQFKEYITREDLEITYCKLLFIERLRIEILLKQRKILKETLFKLEDQFNLKNHKIPLGFTSFPSDFYQSEEWILRSIEILKRDQFKCQLKGSECLEIGNIVHHIRSAKNYPEICLDPNNLVCACKNCHNQLYKNYF